MKHNFCSGPSILPKEVFEAASQAVRELDGSGLSILEISHRSKAFVSILEEAIQLVRDLLHVPMDYEVLFLQGGASSQFAMVPMNLIPIEGKVGFVNTGVWTNKALEDARRFGDVVDRAVDRPGQWRRPRLVDRARCRLGADRGADYLGMVPRRPAAALLLARAGAAGAASVSWRQIRRGP